MPIIDGYQFLKKEIKPDVKVFFMSAYLSDGRIYSLHKRLGHESSGVYSKESFMTVKAATNYI
jgi:hypothetical protein